MKFGRDAQDEPISAPAFREPRRWPSQHADAESPAAVFDLSSAALSDSARGKAFALLGGIRAQPIKGAARTSAAIQAPTFYTRIPINAQGSRRSQPRGGLARISGDLAGAD